MALAAPSSPKYTLTLLKPDGKPATQVSFAYALGSYDGNKQSVIGGGGASH